MAHEGKLLEKEFQKLAELCDELRLSCTFNPESYPISMVIKPQTGVYEQASLFAMEEKDLGFKSHDAELKFYIYEGELRERIEGTFDIDDSVKNKLKKGFKNLHGLYLQDFHHDEMNRLEASRRKEKSLGDGTLYDADSAV